MSKELLEAIDADSAKEVVLGVLDFAASIAAMTPTPVDDKAVATLKNLVDRPLVWRLIIAMINKALPEATPDDTADLEEAIAEAAPGIDPVTIVTLVTTLLPMIRSALEWWRKRREQSAPAPGPEVV